ncbi:MAG: alpha/beta fold hydrolase [Alphaproteobacteria bacterium]|nr:alpha/beta fold hydrolase [Alphaproteobacteria bacterium]
MVLARVLAVLVVVVLGACNRLGVPSMNEESWLMPGGPGDDGKPALLKTRVYFPQGSGPFPVAVINHGSPGEPGRQFWETPSFGAAVEWFVGRGYMVVVPTRRGYGDSGPWPENPGPCANPDFVAAGNAAADDIAAVVGRLRLLKIVRPDRILLVGQSAGGFGVIAAASRNPPGVFGAVNIAGGRLGGQGEIKCAPERLVAANAAFGATAKVPSLWLYAENDSYFGPDLSRAMVSAYGEAGGRAVYVLLPHFKDDGHRVFVDPDGREFWTRSVAAFLEALE